MVHVHGVAERVLHGVADHLVRGGGLLRQGLAEVGFERLPGLRLSRRFFT